MEQGASPNMLAAADTMLAPLAVPIAVSGMVVVRVQAEVGRAVAFGLEVHVEPQLGFPVAGKGNAAIQSFWGQERDGGKRSHEGIDIFAPVGTPVVAGAPGTVVAANTNALGGQVVWLYDPVHANYEYFAHLSRWAVHGGEQVHTGDTLGYVGTTGNAHGAVPHLHFGIYGPTGALDPLPFVWVPVGQASAPTAGALALVGEAVVWHAPKAKRSANQSLAPAMPYAVGKAGDTLFVFALRAGMAAVQGPSGRQAWVPATQLKPLGKART